MADAKKTISELFFPEDYSYYHEHTWVKPDGDLLKIGISDYAQDQLGEIIFFELPDEGDSFAAGEVFGQAESTKTVSALYMPITGEIVSVNRDIEDSPEIVNNSPYDEGWIIAIKPQQIADVQTLLTREQYIDQLK